MKARHAYETKVTIYETKVRDIASLALWWNSLHQFNSYEYESFLKIKMIKHKKQLFMNKGYKIRREAYK